MSRNLVKGNAAEADLIGIWLYSFENWGEAQADRYLNAIEAAIKKIAKSPDRGGSRDWLREAVKAQQEALKLRVEATEKLCKNPGFE